MTLPQVFLDRPFAHRALHDVADGRPENSLAAVRAAIEAGYGIEVDLQLSRDGVPMVFHDYDLKRLTGQTGLVADKTAKELGAVTLLGAGEGIPTLGDLLTLVAGQVPLLIELKDQSETLSPEPGVLASAAAKLLSSYDGPAAVMSFNPHSIVELARLLPDVPRGLTTCDFAQKDWPLVPADRLEAARHFAEYSNAKACFVSHDHADLNSPHLERLRAAGATILCWTICSAEEETAARGKADNITFEGYLA